MRINKIQINPGEEKKIEVNIAKLPSRSSVDVTVYIARSKKKGPTLLLLGGLHGDEINGIEIVRRLVDKGWNIPTSGTTICIPVLNVFGFIHYSRYVPDGRDVNRSFPGSKTGSLASRIAYFLRTEILPHIDFGIDFHTGGAERTNYPQIRGMMQKRTNLEIAKVFNPPFILHSGFRSKSLRQTANKLGSQILIYEGGESSRLDEFAIRCGIEGTIRVMRHFNMTERTVAEASYEQKFIDKSSWLRAPVSGLFIPSIAIGQNIENKQSIGTISDPFGGYQKKLKSPHSGYVIGLNNNPVLHQGDAVIHIGWEE